MCLKPSVIFHYSSNETKPYKMAYMILVALASVSLYNLTLYLFLPFSLHPSHTGLSSGHLTHQVLLCQEICLYASRRLATLFPSSLYVCTFHFSLNGTYSESFFLTTQM